MTSAALIRQLDKTVAAGERMVSSIEAAQKRWTGKVEAKAVDYALSGIKGRVVGSDEEEPDKEIKGLVEYMKTGRISTQASTVANPADAGVLAIGEPVRKVFEILHDESPIMQYAEVLTIEANVGNLVVETGDPEVHWVGESELRPESSIALGQVNVPVNEVTFCKGVSNVLLEDSNVVNVGDFITRTAGKVVSREIGNAFVKGNGDRKPVGLFTSPRLETIKSGKSKGMTFSALTDAIGSIPNAADANARWFMSRSTFWGIVKQFGEDSAYVNIPLTSSIRPALLGYDVVFVNSDGLDKDGNICAVFGDVYNAYKIINRRAMKFIRDEVTGVKYGITNMVFSARVGGDLVMPDSVVGIKVGA